MWVTREVFCVLVFYLPEGGVVVVEEEEEDGRMGCWYVVGIQAAL